MHALGSHPLQHDSEEYCSKTMVRSLVPCALGFLVTSPSFKVIAANQEAATILTYPGRRTPLSVAESFEKRLRQGLLRVSSRSNGHESPSAVQLKSGCRTYYCRTFVLDSDGKAPDASVLVVLERKISGSSALSQISQQFHLTRREQEAVALLLQGLGNKEMAERLGISANTVKAFLRLVMVKMGVSSRSGIVSKVLRLVLSSNEPRLD